MDSRSGGMKRFAILMTIGIIGALADGIAYQIHLLRHGVDLFSFSLVPFAVWTAYVRTFPGNILTCLWLLPWLVGFVCLHNPRRSCGRSVRSEVENKTAEPPHAGDGNTRVR